MAGAKPHFSPHAAYASASASDSTASDFTVSADADIIVFRLLLPRAFGDEDAFHLYDAIVPLRHHTAALQVLDALEGYPEDSASRVAVVLGPTSPSRRVEVSSSGEAVELSPVQEALVALVDIGGVLHRVVGRGPELVTCLVLIEAARLDVLGRRSLGAIASESGAEVRVMSWAEDAARSVHRPEEVVEITGDRTTIRKAIVALCSYLQGDLHADSLTTSVMVASLKLPSTSLEVPETNLGAFHSNGSTECANSNIPWIHCPQGVRDVKSKDLRQISFRLLCHVNLAGGLIGKKGMIIKSFEDETGASIDVGNPISGCMERVITISALESPGPYSKVQSAIICIFERMEELERNGRLTFGKPGCSARVLVPKSQISCLVDLGGVIINEMVKSTGAGIEILDETDVPACASHCERVLQKLANASDIGIINSKNEVQKSASGCGAVLTGVEKPADGDGDRINNSNIVITSPNENKLLSHQIIKDPVVTRMSYKVAACEGVLSLLYGNEENYLAHLRQISGAYITIYAPRPEESSDSTIVISGTPGQAQIALAALLDLTRQKA